MMMIAHNSRARKRGKIEGEYGEIWGEEEGIADYREMVQPNQQNVAQCVKGNEWGLGTNGLRIVAAFWDSIPISSA